MPATVEVITNKGFDSLSRVLRDLLTRATNADLAVAFATEAGVGQILRRLYEVARRGRARVLTGLFEHVTEPGALRLLLRAEEDTRGRLSVRVARHNKFHAKLYLVRRGRALYAIVGSSNLTEDGLLSSGERNVLLRLPAKSAEGRRLTELFDAEWGRQRSAKVTREFIRHYERVRRPPQRATRAKSVSALLREGVNSERAAHPGEDEEPTYWRTYVGGVTAQRTVDVIAEETDWEQKGYWWFSLPLQATVRKIREGDRLLMFDLTPGAENLFAAKVIDKVPRTSRPTPDGRSFVAVRRLRWLPARRLTARRWNILVERRGLLRNRHAARQHRHLKPHQWERFLDGLRKP